MVVFTARPASTGFATSPAISTTLPPPVASAPSFAVWSSAPERFQFLQERRGNFSQRLDAIVERRFLQMNHRGNAV